jgi:hypothetical protein
MNEDLWTEHLTPEFASIVRAWRIRGLTWRQVTQDACTALGLPPSQDQTAGEDLCRRSAQLLGENPDELPWNNLRKEV